MIRALGKLFCPITFIDFLEDADKDKDVFRTKTFMYVSDLARKSPRVHAKKSSLYHWNLITIAIFYGLPVVQLVLTYQVCIYIFRAQLFTSLTADLYKDINRVSSFSRCLNGTFP